MSVTGIFQQNTIYGATRGLESGADDRIILCVTVFPRLFAALKLTGYFE